MLERLSALAHDASDLQTKLVLVVGGSHADRSGLLTAFALANRTDVLNIGLLLARRLTHLSQKERQSSAAPILEELAEAHAQGMYLLVNNLEILFDRSLQLDPILLLRSYARRRTVLAAWPGNLLNGRLCYAELGHPEHREYQAKRTTILDVTSS